MIFDDISRLQVCRLCAGLAGLSPMLLEFLSQAAELPDGRHDLSLGIYAGLDSYTPKKEAFFESHRRYADMQIVLAGSEFLDIIPAAMLESAATPDSAQSRGRTCAAPEKWLREKFPGSAEAAGPDAGDKAPGAFQKSGIKNDHAEDTDDAAKQPEPSFLYNPEKDIQFYPVADVTASRIHLTPGRFILLPPWDAHKPCLSDGLFAGIVRKCVIKIPVELLRF